MNLTRFLFQTVTWQQVASTNDRDDPTYAAGVSLAARKMQRLRDVIGKDGEVTTATNEILLGPNGSSVSVADLIDGREVVAIQTRVDIHGNVVGYLASTR